MKYYDSYNSTPSPEVLEAETGYLCTQRDISKDEVIYTTKEIEHFCKNKAIEEAFIEASVLYKEEKIDDIEEVWKNALMVSLNPHLGLRYFETVNERLEDMDDNTVVTPTLWKEVDDALFGGISRKEMLLVSGGPGGGKSLVLANLGFNIMKQKLNVLYISLELSEYVVAQRYDQFLTGISRRDWKSHKQEISTRVQEAGDEFGILDIIQLPSGTRPKEIEAYLKEYYLHYNMMPDMMIVDYLDKMHPNQNVNLGDVWTKDKLCSEQLRDIAVINDMFFATASQLGRSSVGATEHNHSHIAGGISKINESDIYWSILMTSEMKAAGDIIFQMQKTRNSDGVGRNIKLHFDQRTLRILNPDEEVINRLSYMKPDKKKENKETKEENIAIVGSDLYSLFEDQKF
jgi:hypothetical protein